MRVGYTILGQTKVKIIGDVHLGRRFVNGVPLHRRGEREAMVLKQFERELLEVDGADIVIQIGDVFDKFAVPNEVLMDACRAISRAWIANHQHTSYFFIRGNHDASNDLTKVSSFDVLAMMTENDRVRFYTKPTAIFGEGEGDLLGLVPYDPTISAVDLVEKLPGGPYRAVFGHWDLESYGGHEFNLIPIEPLKKITNLAFTGHEHKPRSFENGDLKVIGVGSMQPYAHGEELLSDNLYYTFTRLEAEQVKIDLRDKCVRVLLEPGEALPDIDCLQLLAKRTGAGAEEDISVEIGDFDFSKLFDEAFAGVRKDVADEMRAKFLEVRLS